MTGTERATAYNIFLHERQLCCWCKKKDARTEAGRWYCAECAAKQRNCNRRVAEGRKQKGVCCRCGRPVQAGSRMCPSCQAYHRDKKRERDSRRRTAGICLCCEGPALPGRCMCARHLEDARQRALERYRRLKAKAPQQKYNKQPEV